MSNYYVSGCKGQDDDIVTCDDSEAEFWTIYRLDSMGLSQGLVDFTFREDAEAAMKVYEEREALQEQLTATANSLTNAQEALKSAGIEADTVQAGVMELVDKLRIKQNHIKLRDTYIEELEQRAEAAEAKADNLNNGWLNAISERDDARAKLAELEKQEAIFQVEVSGNHWLNAGPVEDSDFTGLPDGINLLYARPAPAIDLNAVRAEGLDMAAAEIDRWVGCGSLAREIRQKSIHIRAGNAGKDGV